MDKISERYSFMIEHMKQTDTPTLATGKVILKLGKHTIKDGTVNSLQIR